MRAAALYGKDLAWWEWLFAGANPYHKLWMSGWKPSVFPTYGILNMGPFHFVKHISLSMGLQNIIKLDPAFVHGGLWWIGLRFRRMLVWSKRLFFQAHRSWLILDWHFWHGCAMAAMVFHSNLFVYLHTSDLNPPKRWSEIMIGTGACAFTWLFHPTHRGHPKNWIHNHFIWSIFATSVQHYI